MKVITSFVTVIILVILSISGVQANWYGNHAVGYSHPGGTALAPMAPAPTGPDVGTFCSDDGASAEAPDPSYGHAALAQSNDSATLIPHGGGALGVFPSGDMRCLYWDSTPPALSADNSSLTWTNGLVPITLTATDYGGSFLNGPTVKYRWNDANCAGGTVFGNGAIINLSFVGEGDHTLYLCANDIAGNPTSVSFNPYKYDITKPVNGAISYPSGWYKNTTILVTVSAGDLLSGIAQYEIEYRESNDSPGFAVWGAWTPLPVITTSASPYVYSFLAPPTPGTAYQFQFRTKDNAGNWSDMTPAPALIYMLDTVDPDPAQFNPTAPTASGAHLIATLNKNFIFSYGETGSPVSITGNFEQNMNPFATDVIGPLAFGTYSFNRDISNVNSDIGLNGGRNINFTITNIKDEAGNEVNIVKPSSWYVYADKDNATSTPSAFGGPYVADGQPQTWNITLLDQFNNSVIPATGISRVVDLSLSNITNSMFLNQYVRSGDTSVFISTPSYGEQPLNTGAGQALGLQGSLAGIYPITIKTYTPTGDSGGSHISDPSADFSFEPTFTITDSLTPAKVLANASPNFIYTPLFTTSIAGDILNGGFIEGVEQNSTINVVSGGGGPGPLASTFVNLEFSGAFATISNFDFYADSTTPITDYPFGILKQFDISPGFPGGTSLNTRLTQKATSVVAPTSDLVLSSHLSYVLNTKSVVTNSFVIGRAGGYFGATIGGQGTQVGVKILGSLSSKNVSQIITDQFTSGISMFNNVNRGMLRQAIRKNVALAIRNSTGSLIVGTINNADSIPGAGFIATGRIISPTATKSIMYIEKDGGDIVLAASSISGIRTIVVKGANLYITNSIAYANSDSMLGVVVQKNDLGQGGNLYIDPSITNLVGTYVIDGSIMSYDGVGVLGYDASISDLNNQLYLFGGIVSENTIGGSKQVPPKCPSLASTCVPTMEDTQKYDLNYLRRYYLFNGEPFGNAKVIGGETCPAGICTNLFALPQKFTLSSDPLAQYPFIIEFNPNILRTQPIGFENILE